jgi:hypothetical protein
MKALILLAAMAAAPGIYPDPALTPGAILTQDEKIVCKTGYTAGVRAVPAEAKVLVFRRYGVPPAAERDYVIDHFIPLELGGANDIANLWPQRWPYDRQKDAVESYLYFEVCNGRMALPDAQAAIAEDWRGWYPPPLPGE